MLEILSWVLGQFERDDCSRLLELLSAIVLSDAYRDKVNENVGAHATLDVETYCIELATRGLLLLVG
jgi:hypothetical protein